jgi:hypothetical protein
MTNTAVDEHFATFYSTVIAASAREAASMVVDMFSGGVPQVIEQQQFTL